jgi:hypothetical protein
MPLVHYLIWFGARLLVDAREGIEATSLEQAAHAFDDDMRTRQTETPALSD